MADSSAEFVRIQPVGPVHGRIRPPGSKSITNRALICAALAEGTSRLVGALDSQDTQVMRESLARLGIAVNSEQQTGSAHELVVHGCGGRLVGTDVELYVANSGTSMRFLTAMVSVGQGSFRLDGTPRMRERPIGDLVEALTALGVSARALSPAQCPPVEVRADGWHGGTATIRGNLSSQFLSGLLMAAPYARAPVTLRVEGELVSQPYVRMTLEVMQAFSVKVATPGPDTFEVPAPLAYRGRRYAIEPDASAASYFLAAAAIAGGEACVEGLTRESLQGDVAFADVLGQMGCRVWQSDEGLCVAGGQLRGVDVDMNAISDTVQTLAAVALFAEGPTTVRGVHHMRHKETDRLAALATELRKLGAIVEELPAGLVIHPAALHGATLHTYDDHRMAMSLALVGLRQPGVVIRDPGCTAKTYPGFFDDLARLAPGSVRWD